jgi:hypothetical protein
MKRVLAIISLALLAIIVAAYFYFVKKDPVVAQNKEASLYKAVPLDAPFFLEIKSVANFPKDNKVYSTIQKTGFFSQFTSLISRIDSSLAIMGAGGTELRNEPFLIAMNLEGRDNFIPLFIAKAETSHKEKNLESFVSAIFPNESNSIKHRNYNNEKIYEINSGQSGDYFCYSFSNGLFIASQRSLLVEKVIRQFSSGNLFEHEGFMQIQKTAAAQAQASLYINHRYFPPLLKKWLSPVAAGGYNEFSEERKTNPRNRISAFSNFAEWTELDLAVHPNELQLNGISAATDSASQYIAIIKQQAPTKIGIDQVLPGNAAMYFSLTFSNSSDFFKDLEVYYSHNATFYSRAEKLKRMISASQTDVKAILQKQVDNEIGMAYLNVPADPMQKNSCFVVSVKSKNQAKEDLIKWLSKYATTQKKTIRDFQSALQIGQGEKTEIYEFPFPSFPGIWLGIPFTSVSAAYFTFWDNYILFTNSKESMENLLHDLSMKNTLANDAAYIQYRQNINDKANIHFYMNINDAYPLNNEFFIPELASIFKAKEENLRKLASLNWQVSNSNDLLYHTLLLNYSEEVKSNVKPAWQVNIGARLAVKPQFVSNHTDAAYKEIMAFDQNNKLYLLSSEGKIKWNIQLPEPILGEITQVDLYKNGKLQYLFNTKSKIYVVDREGSNVGSYPVALKSPATNGIAVFDYDNNRSYRLFVACEDKKIYVFDGSGKPVSGWKFGKTEQPVTTPVQHFRVNKKDFVVFKDESRIYILDRQGQQRAKVSEKFDNSSNPLILQASANPKLVSTDKKGNIRFIGFDGMVTTKKTPGFGENHWFSMSDLTGDESNNYIFGDNDKLTFVDENGKATFTYQFKNTGIVSPGVYSFASSKKVGLANAGENKIYLFNPDGTIQQGFPLKGAGPFTIGSLATGSKRLMLVAGNTDGNVYCYKLD